MTMAYTTNEKIGAVRVKAIRMLRDGKSTREVSRYLGYAQSTIVKWNKRRYEARQNTRELPTRSSRPHTSPRRTPREIEGMILIISKLYLKTMAGIHGFEPRLKASKASVLPLDDIPI